jgi:hypothetical protein
MRNPGGSTATIDDCFIVHAAPWKPVQATRVESLKGISMLNLYLAALVVVIVPNIVAIVAIAALIRRDLARALEP